MGLSQSAAAITIVAETNIIRQPHCETALLGSFTDQDLSRVKFNTCPLPSEWSRLSLLPILLAM